MSTEKRINIEKPRWDQSTFIGRAKHFFATTNPLNVFATNEELDSAKNIVTAYRRGENLNLSEDELWRAKQLYDSAFHVQTGEKLFIVGRMSFQVPGNMTITGCMMTFYRSTPAVIFWQWANQSFNAIVNYTNRNASVSISNEQLGQAYLAATSASVVTAVGLNKLIARSPTLSNGLVGRLVPLMAVAAANFVNIPLMRQRELKDGIEVYSPDGTVVGNSQIAAKSALIQVIPSRIGMAAPPMFAVPVIMNWLSKGKLLTQRPILNTPFSIFLTGFFLAFSTPLCCALFPQEASLPLDRLEPEIQNRAKELFPNPPSELFFNKGL